MIEEDKMKPTISVIVPVYNVGRYITRCLDSLEAQSYKDIEVIIVDDGSTDKSGELAREYALSHRKFTYIRQNNAGQGAARNTGLKVAQGKYVAFVDSDDYVDKLFCEKLYQAIVTNHADISVCSAVRVWEDGTRKPNYATETADEVITDMPKYLYRMGFSVWNKLYDKRLFHDIWFPEHMKYEDFATLPRIVSKAKKIASISDELYMYFWRADSTVNTKSVSADIWKAQKLLGKSDLAVEHPEILPAYFVKMCMGSLLWEMFKNDTVNYDEVSKIMASAKMMYPYLAKENFGELMGAEKILFGRLLIVEQYKMAKAYVHITEKVITMARKGKQIIMR